MYPDATEQFAATLNDPTKWVLRQGVPIFKPHRRVDPNTGREIVVDVPKLYRIAANLQRMERDGGVPIRMTLGHTEPGKPETQQPPVAGYYRNARVANFGPKGEPAVVVDEWLDPAHRGSRKNFPYRSSEYYDDTEQITGVALLTRDPYLDLGVVAYEGVTLPVKGPVLYSAAGQPRTAYQYLLGDTNMWPYGYDTNGTPLPAPQAPTAAPIHPAQAAPVYPTPYSAPHVHTGYGMPTPANQSVPQRPVQTAVLGYAQPQPAPLAYGQQPSGAPFTGGYNQSPAAMSHSSDWQYRGPHQGQRYADQIPGQQPIDQLTGPGTPPEEGDDEAGLNALHHHMSQAVEHLSRYMQAGRKPSPYGPDPMGQPPMPQGPPQAPPGFPPGQGSADSPYSRGQRPGAYAGSDEIRGSNQAGQIRAMWAKDPVDPTHDTYSARRYSDPRLPVAYQLEIDKLQAKMQAQDAALKVVMYERDQADTAACEAEIRRLAHAGWAVDANDVNKLKATPVDQRPAFLNEVMTKYSRVGTESLPPIMGDPSPMHQVGQDPNGGRATREQMYAALKTIPNDAPPEVYQQALQSVQYGGPQAQFGMNGEPQGPGNPFGDPYGT